MIATSWSSSGMPPCTGSMISFLWIPKRSSMFKFNWFNSLFVCCVKRKNVAILVSMGFDRLNVN